ncbi:MAG: IS4 family transposase [Bacteroidota bacterium]
MGRKSQSIFGDKRLDKGFHVLIAAMAVRHTVVMKELSTTRAEEVQMGRFMQNPNINPEQLVTHSCSVNPLLLEGKDVLVISDSSTISFNAYSKREELGHVGPNTSKDGFSVHPAILMAADEGSCYGLGGIHFHKTPIAHTEQERAMKKERRKRSATRAFEDKERYKWFDAPSQAIANCPLAKSYTLIGDRESDIYDLMARTRAKDWHFLYRCKNNRSLSSTEDKDKLYEAIQTWSVAHTFDLALQKTKKRTAHTATLDVKFGQTQIAKPHINTDKSLPAYLEISVVQVKERLQTVVGEEKPVHWILLTSHPVQTLEQALTIIKWYRWRWTIEQLFRTIKKQGFRIEQSKIETYHGLINLTTMALLAAIQVMQLVQARAGDTSQNLEDVFYADECKCIEALNQKLEGKTQKQKNPHPTHTLAFGAWVVARLGGWKGYQSESPPGPITFTKGLTRFYHILEGYQLFS